MKQNGITLVELLIVTGVSILLITGFMVLINPLQKIAQTNDAKVKAELAQLQRILELYYQDYGKYPVSSSNKILDTSIKDWGTSWTPYIQKLPKDPTSGHNYVYYSPSISSGVCANNQCYYLYANLQQGGYDRQSCVPGSGKPGTACPSAITNNLDTSCGTGGVVCNFGISSPNVSP